MKLIKSIIGFYLALTIVSGCSKIDWKNIPNGNDRKCDYVQASSTALSDEYTQELPLFTKYYSQNKLQKIEADFRNIAGGPYNLAPLKVSYQGRRINLVDEAQGDTVAIFDFNQAGKLQQAQAAPTLFDGWANRYLFRFLYAAGILKEIQYMETDDNPSNDEWFPYLKLEYGTNKNVSKVSFYGFGKVTTDHFITYTYDYTKKARGQFYADEMQGDYFYFWYLVKYLNFFPELQPVNVLLSSYNQVEYPGNIERKYSDHTFDATGYLISYKQNEELWKVKWNCSK